MRKFSVSFWVLALLIFALPAVSYASVEDCPDKWIIDTSKYPNPELTSAKNKLGINMVETVLNQQITQYRGELGETSKIDNLLIQREDRPTFYYLYGKSNVETTVKVEVRNCLSQNFVFNTLYSDSAGLPFYMQKSHDGIKSVSPKNPQFFDDFKMQESFSELVTRRKAEINEVITEVKNNKAPVKFLNIKALSLSLTSKKTNLVYYGPLALTEGCVKPTDDGWMPSTLIFGKKCTFGWLFSDSDKYAVLEPFVLDLTLPTSSSRHPAEIKKVTITCVKGKLTKKVTAVNPKCPAGYKKK